MNLIDKLMNSAYNFLLSILTFVVTVLRIIYLSLASFLIFIIISLIAEYQKDSNIQLGTLVSHIISKSESTLDNLDLSNFHCKAITDNASQVIELNCHLNKN